MTNYSDVVIYNNFEVVIIVIYADILFTINFFITFLLLETAAKLSKKEAKTARLVLASIFGGAYSMIIFVKLDSAESLVLKAFAAAVIVLIAFRFYRLKSFFFTYLIFLFSSFLFLGIIIGLYLLFKTKLIAVNNSTVYFDIKARELLICALFAYAVSSVVVRLYNKSVSRGELFMLEIFYGSKSVKVFALSDTGNKLREPFSSGSVIVLKSEAAGDLFDGAPFRLVPASTVNSSSYLRAYKPDKTVLKNAKGEEVIENVYVALSDNIKSESYSAIINPEVLSV